MKPKKWHTQKTLGECCRKNAAPTSTSPPAPPLTHSSPVRRPPPQLSNPPSPLPTPAFPSPANPPKRPSSPPTLRTPPPEVSENFPPWLSRGPVPSPSLGPPPPRREGNVFQSRGRRDCFRLAPSLARHFPFHREYMEVGGGGGVRACSHSACLMRWVGRWVSWTGYIFLK